MPWPYTSTLGDTGPAGGNFDRYEGIAVDGGLSLGEASPRDIDALNKALSAGSETVNPGAVPGEGFALRPESLESTLHNVTYADEHVKFWKKIAKDKAYNTVEEFNQLLEYGSGEAAFIAEGDLPTEDDSTYLRNLLKIKFMGTTRRITHPMTLVRQAHGDIMARETLNGTLWLLKQLEVALFNGDENMIPVQFDGLETSLVKAWGSTLLDDGQYAGYEDDNVFDLRGGYIGEDYTSDVTEKLINTPNYGQPNELWGIPGTVNDIGKAQFPKGRYDLGSPPGTVGFAPKSIKTPFGDIELNHDIFLPYSQVPIAAGQGAAARRPGAPTLGVPASPAYGGSNTTYFGTSDAATYIYKVVAGSRHGRSTPVESAQIAVSSGDEVTFTVTDTGPSTSYYIIYRSDPDGAASTCKEIMRVKRTAAVQTIHDLNRFLPGTSRAYELTHNSNVLKWKQLAPFTRIPLATIDTSQRWMQVLYGAMQVSEPRKNAIFINVGRFPTGANA